LGVGREANNLTLEKNSTVHEPNRGKNWSDLLERHGRGKGLKNEMRRMGVTNWSIRAHRRDDWKMVVKEAKVLQGL